MIQPGTGGGNALSATPELLTSLSGLHQLKTLALKDGYKDNQKLGFKRTHYPWLYEIPAEFDGKIKTPGSCSGPALLSAVARAVAGPDAGAKAG